MYSVPVGMTHAVCRIVHPKIKSACVHRDVITSHDVCETANGPRLLFFTTTLGARELEQCMYVVVYSEYHHSPVSQAMMIFSLVL